ncbi:MAG: ATP-binding protein [Bacteroidetes bacterium]|nr:ATP-binding protein [Bacteroidota bacterium]
MNGHHGPLIGREEELAELVRNLSYGRHTLITGLKGIGKSRLMAEARAVLAGERRRMGARPGTRESDLKTVARQFKILYVIHTAPMGDLLRELLKGLYNRGDLRLEPPLPDGANFDAVRKRLSGKGSVYIQDLLIQSLADSQAKYLLFLDSLDRISPTHQLFLERLLTVAIVCAAVTRMKETFYYRKIWASFTRIKLEPFNGAAAREVVRYYMERFRVRTIDPELFAREVLKSADGNPHRIRSLVWHGSREPHLDRQAIRKLRRDEEGDYFNMGPVYIFGASVFTLYKIFSLGLDNRESYIYFSALGFLVYFAFRVFRNFFLFRPQSGE